MEHKKNKSLNLNESKKIKCDNYSKSLKNSQKKVVHKYEGKKISTKDNKTKSYSNKKMYYSKEYMFLIISISFILLCFLFYGSRLVYFYGIEHPKILKNENIYNVLTLKKNIVEQGDGLYKEDKNKYIYKGKNIDNYVKYSGRLWRIVSINDNGIKLITEDNQTSLVWGLKTNYEKSLVKSWLNDKKDIKSFYESLSNTEILTKTKTCVDIVSKTNISCNKIIEEKVGLLSVYEYQEAGAEKSYLNIGEYWWTSSIDANNLAWYIYSIGALNNNVSLGKIYYAYGVRPTITIKSDIKVISGSGKRDDPYCFVNTTNNMLNSKYVGEYINYSGYTWRIIETDKEYTKIVMNGVIKNNNDDLYKAYGSSNYMTSSYGLGYYLNNVFYNSLENKEFILKYPFNMGRYDKTYKYDYNMIAEYKEKMHIGLLQLGELFINDIDNYFLSTRTITSDGSIYEVIKDGKIYLGAVSDKQRVRPTLYLKNDIVVNSGSGSISDPYKIG